ncbi:hypothetical protein Tco_0543078 [Tanacetum coccineum]
MVKSSSSLCKELILREIASEIHSWGPYQYRMIKEPDDLDHTPPVLPSSHLQTDDELTTEEAKIQEKEAEFLNELGKVYFFRREID